MCFVKTRGSKVLVAKRDIQVYKIGIYASDTVFNPLFYYEFKYLANRAVYEEVLFNSKIIECGLHSYINCIIYPIYSEAVDLWALGHLQCTLSLSVHSLFLGEFIIPKGATYCLNIAGQVVSNKLIYTGDYIRIMQDVEYNTKELWKEK